MKGSRIDQSRSREAGAALVTVILISLLLGTACIAMLTAVGAGSRNGTDALSEYKAYYAAESGLQATINFLRNDTTVTPNSSIYSYANANQSLSAKLPYNWPTSGPATRVVVGDTASNYTPNTGTAYAINVDDPDDSEIETTFSTNASFLSGGPGTVSADGLTMYVPNQAAINRTEIRLTVNTGSTVVFANNPANPRLGTFSIQNFGTGASLAAGTKAQFQFNYVMSDPRPASRTIRGWVEPAAANTPPTVLKFISQNYELSGGTIELCSATARPGTSPGCATVTSTLVSGAAPLPVYLFLSPVPPIRLVVTSTGYGPTGALKILQGIVQRNYFDGLGTGAAISMVGGNCVVGPKPLDHCFDAGTSSQVDYSGGSSETGVPTFGLTDPTYLNYVQTHPPHGDPSQMQPPPAMLSDAPEWEQSPAAMETLINSLRTAAENSGTYFKGTDPGTVGNYTTGTGLTFCEGSCTVGGNGGGILVVTGKLTSSGGFNFKGLIIVVGEEGFQRNGNGGGTITGNVVIAPYYRMLPSYSPTNLSSTFLPPRFWVNGGGNSDVIYSDVSTAFDNLSSISDIMLGVAEK